MCEQQPGIELATSRSRIRRPTATPPSIRKSECKVNLGSRNSSRSNGSWQMTPKLYPATTWRMDLRQLTVYKLRALRVCQYARYNFLCLWTKVHHVSCKKFGEDIPTSMEVIGAQTLNFRPKFKFLRLNFDRRIPSPLGGALGCPG